MGFLMTGPMIEGTGPGWGGREVKKGGRGEKIRN